MPRQSIPQRLGLLAAVSAVAGLVAAGLALPVVGGAGLLARAGSRQFDQLPSELVAAPLPQRSRILAADGSTLATFYYENRIVVPLDQVAPIMQKAIIGIEDARFYEHHGIDFKGVARAALHDQSTGGLSQGGSTITQQYVKLVLVEQADDKQARQEAHEKSFARKLREARYALALEDRLSKEQILERYLNIAYFGDGAYGIGSAAQHFFGVPASRLTLPQAALLAGLVQNPDAYNPRLHPKAATDRRNTVLERLAQLHYVTASDAAAAEQQPLGLHAHKQENGCESSAAPFFCDYVLHQIQASPAFGATRADRVKLLLRGGLTITTTLDPKVQKAAQDAVHAQVPASTKSGYAAAEAVVEPGTGAIKAIAVSRPYGSGPGQTRIDYAVDQAYGGGTGFQSGSTAKLLVLTAALQKGFPLSTSIFAPSVLHDVTGFTNCSGQDVGTYPVVGNADPAEAGTYDLRTGTWQSVNTFFVLLERKVGLCPAAEAGKELGLSRADGTPLHQTPSMTLGTNEVSPLDLANAYATIAAHGKRCDPTAISAVTDAGGKPITLPPTDCVQAVDPGIADTVSSVLRGVLDTPHGTAAAHALSRPAAGKTGTVEDYNAAWFVGYTPQLSAAVWLGFPDAPTAHFLTDITIGGRYYTHVYGGDVPAIIWHDTMTAALAGIPVEPLAGPDASVARGRTITVPDVTGMQPQAALDAIRTAGLSATLADGPIPSAQPQGAVAATNPTADSQVSADTTVTVYLSSGVLPVLPTPTLSAGPAGGPSTAPSGGPVAAPSGSAAPGPPRHGPPRSHPTPGHGG